MIELHLRRLCGSPYREITWLSTAQRKSRSASAPSGASANLMDKLRKAGLLAKGGQPHQRNSTGSVKDPVATLAEQGVDKNLADRARKAAAMTEKQFEAAIARAIS
jgi:hypothetical protein